MAKRIQDASDRVACWMIYRDFDGDGAKEAFVYACDLASGKGTELPLRMAQCRNCWRQILTGHRIFLNCQKKLFICTLLREHMQEGLFCMKWRGIQQNPPRCRGQNIWGMENLLWTVPEIMPFP